MADKLINGDYAMDISGKAITVEYVNALLQDIAVTLNTKRFRFYPNKNFGSHIREINALPAEEYVFAYAAQALDKIDGVTVKGAAVNDGTATVYLIINGEEKEVSIKLENNL